MDLTIEIPDTHNNHTYICPPPPRSKNIIKEFAKEKYETIYYCFDWDLSVKYSKKYIENKYRELGKLIYDSIEKTV
jgi:hypothetical protein